VTVLTSNYNRIYKKRYHEREGTILDPGSFWLRPSRAAVRSFFFKPLNWMDRRLLANPSTHAQ